jgi:methylated-DNA-protein-cysteine methyltransferase-like protein
MSKETSPIHKQIAILMARVFALVQACPAGRVTTYSWIGKALGYPRGARMIGWIMNEAPQGVPAQRVINSKGELSGSWAFGQKGKMRQLLEAEGITFSADERVDLKRYGWDPSRDLSEEDLKHIVADSANTAVNLSNRLLHLMLNDPASPFREADNSS